MTVNVNPNQSGTVKINQIVETTYPTSSTFKSGTSVNIEAIPAAGFEFAGWSGSITSQDNPTTVDMTCPKDITAVFTETEGLSLTIEVNGFGSVTPSAGSYLYRQGTVINIIAIPDTGYYFTDWTGEVENNRSSQTTVTLDTDKIVIANFSKLINLTIEINGAGSVTPSAGNFHFSMGARVAITATPDSGYKFDGWTGGEVSDASSDSTMVIMDTDKTIIANFSSINSDSSTTDTSVSIDGDKDVNANPSEIGMAPWLLAIIIIASLVVLGGIIWLVLLRRRSGV